MAEEVLFEILDGAIPLQEVLMWISNETCDPDLQAKLICSRSDFVLCILNFLRLSTAGAWQESTKYLSPIKSASKHSKFKTPCRKLSPRRSSDRQYVRRVELFPKSESDTGPGRVDQTDGDLNATGSPKTNSPNVLRDHGGKSTPKNNVKADENPFLVPELSCPLTSSPFSNSRISDVSPQFTPINKRVQIFKSNEGRSTPVPSKSPEYQIKTPSRSNGISLADFIVKGGRSTQTKKRVSQSPPRCSVMSPNGSNDDIHGSQSNKKKHKRRINPTKVSLEISTASPATGFSKMEPFGTATRPVPETSPFKAPVSMEPSGALQSFSEERSLLKQERLKLQVQVETAVSQTLNSSVPSKSIVPKILVAADPQKVTHSEQLLKIKDLYCCVLDANLVPNLMSELYFIVSLLVIRCDMNMEENEDNISNLESSMQNISLEQEDAPGNESSRYIFSPIKTHGPQKNTNYFSSIHNCVFFASHVLSQQVDVLGNLDRITLKLLVDSERIALFSPMLREKLSSLYLNCVSIFKGPIVSTKAGNVSFQSDTDNSSNFPSTQCFSTFRKQRDGFYELLRIWEANHLKQGWCFSTTLGSRVRSLVHLCSDPVNLMHFARLFRLQLVSTVDGESKLSGEEHEDLEFLEGLRGVDPSKLNRLRGRLVTPYKGGGPRPAPSFPGPQEFYRDFIISCSHSSFMQHLQDSIISHLLELDQTSFLASDTEESDYSVDAATRQCYLSSAITMRLLAKFLGLIVFLPYSRPEMSLPQNIVETEVSVRSKVMPPLNIHKCVVDAHKSHRLVVTIPWVVKFLGMMDSVSCTLPIYQSVLQLLLHLYISLRRGSYENWYQKNVLLPPQTVILLRFSLGWLFEASFIQEGFFYSWCFNLDESLLMMALDVGDTSCTDHSLSVLDSSDILSISSSTVPPVDSLNLVDCEVLYALCPFLTELRALLASTSSECAPGSSARHITPVSAGSAFSSSTSSVKQLELKLEDSFFHGLPASVHRTVEFVVERVTSSCVKHICNVWLPGLKQKGVLQLQEKIKSLQGDRETETKSTSIQGQLKKEINAIVEQVSMDLKSKCRSGVGEFCSTKCQGALMSLLPEESLSLPVCEMCVSIASRMSEERVIAWMQTHATLSLYSKDLESEAEKSLKNRDRCENIVASKTSHIAPGASATWTHDDSVPSPFRVLQNLKLMVCDVLSGHDVSKENLYDILDKMEQCVSKRQDVVPAAERILALLSVDLVVALVCHNPRLVDSTLLSRLISLWKMDALRPVEDGLSRLVCPRNMLLLAQSGHPTRLVWEKLADVVAAVLKANLVTPDLVENQCLAIMQQEWPQNILRCFAMCMNEVVRQYQKQRDVDYKFVLLLEWLSETMAQMDYFPQL